MTKSSLLFAVLALLVMSAGCGSDNKPIRVDVHELSSNPNPYYGNEVEIEACLLVSRHGMGIADCKERKSIIDVEFSSPGSRSAALTAFIQDAQNEWSPGEDGVLRANLTGNFVAVAGRKTLVVNQASALPL